MRPVATNTIRDARVVREISTAPVVRGPLQVVPVASSIRVSTKSTGSAPRPPAAALNRPVVTRLAPAPAPALFHEKANLIRENHGAPVDPAQAARLSPVSRAIQPTRSVVVESGRVTLTPKKPQGSAIPAPVPVTRQAAPGQAHPQQDAKQQQQIDARKTQEAEAARKAAQQQLDARKAQEAEAARVKQQQGLDAAKVQKQQQEAEAARREAAAGARCRKGAEATARGRSRSRETAAGARRRKGAEATAGGRSRRVKQQQGLDAAKAQKQQQEAEAARVKQQQGLDAAKAQKQQQEAEAARVKQQQGLDAAKVQKQQQRGRSALG